MSSEELAQAIESLVAGYVEAGQRAATQAVEVAFARSRVGGGRPRTRSVERSRGGELAPRRRTQAELQALTERLLTAVRAAPGESMARFAEDLGVPSAELQRPMSRLRDAGQVRSVGERHLTRYFPSVGAKC